MNNVFSSALMGILLVPLTAAQYNLQIEDKKIVVEECRTKFFTCSVCGESFFRTQQAVKQHETKKHYKPYTRTKPSSKPKKKGSTKLSSDKVNSKGISTVEPTNDLPAKGSIVSSQDWFISSSLLNQQEFILGSSRDGQGKIDQVPVVSDLSKNTGNMELLEKDTTLEFIPSFLLLPSDNDYPQSDPENVNPALRDRENDLVQYVFKTYLHPYYIRSYNTQNLMGDLFNKKILSNDERVKESFAQLFPEEFGVQEFVTLENIFFIRNMELIHYLFAQKTHNPAIVETAWKRYEKYVNENKRKEEIAKIAPKGIIAKHLHMRQNPHLYGLIKINEMQEQ